MTINVESQVDDPASVFSHYRRLIALRYSEPLVVSGRYSLLEPHYPTLFAFTRVDDDHGLLVPANWSGSPLDVPSSAVDGWSDASLLMGNYPGPASVGARLRPWEAVVFRR
ncbi:DUF3459 domain-containing protein [Amycolatopsis sp. NPDC051372]|uniref:DUF3459 domain-containing protein n=1 Tax=Amycolatopsis sp. NPDC051372 TaxID=3155669 RepID=UPI00341C92FF